MEEVEEQKSGRITAHTQIQDHDLPIAPNKRIDPDPRLRLLEDVVGHAYTVASAYLVRSAAADAAPSIYQGWSLAGSKLLAACGCLQQPAAPAEFPTLQQLRAVRYG